MKQNKVISLAGYKSQLLSAAKRESQRAVVRALPSADNLWELLDKNISLSVWVKKH
jgi:hypothetical protein